jgi:HPt (histidine-containing phosphotransfer) domain-containing protein
MAYHFHGFDSALVAAVGDDEGLIAELRTALYESASYYADLLERSRCDANWESAAHRLKGVAASFGASAVASAADFALSSAPGDPVALRKVKSEVSCLKA